jgi:hypothetical protein
MAAILPLELIEPVASPLRPSGPKAILMLPPNVKEPADMNDLCGRPSGQNIPGIHRYTYDSLPVNE